MAAAEPRASIVIPTFNRADRVVRAIDTALEQTVPCEVIVVDHGSKDHTSDVVQGYGERVRYLRRDTDNGPFYGWLDGVIHASADKVHITYDDDYIAPDFTEKCLAQFGDDCAYVFTGVQGHAEEGEDWSQFDGMFATGSHPAREIERYLLRTRLTISPGCAFFRKADALQALLVGKVPLSTSDYHGVGPDLLLFLMPLLRYPRFAFVDERLAHFVAHKGSITTDAMADAARGERLRAGYDEAKNYYLALRQSKSSLRQKIRKWKQERRRQRKARAQNAPAQSG